MSVPRIAIVGGGISGLACANRLQEIFPEASIHILEAQNRLGGAIETLQKQGFVLEGGPDCFIADKPFIEKWLQRTGLKNSIIGTEPVKRRSYILLNGKLNKVPAGFYLISPTSFKALLQTTLLSLAGKLRTACEYWVPAKRDGRDESVADFIRRRFGAEVLKRIGQPMVAGIYTADPEKLSMKAAMPQLYAMEQEHGSVLRALKAKNKNAAEREASGPRYSLFLSLQQGMEQLISGLAAKLHKAQIHTAFTVKSLEKNSVWKIHGENGEVMEADAVCLAIPAFRAAGLLQSFAPEMAAELEGIAYEPAATLNLAYEAGVVPKLPEGFGLVIPASEKRKIVGLTFSSQKFPGRAPQNHVLIRVFMGGAFHRGILEWSDTEIQIMVRQELKKLLGIEAVPLFSMLRRYPRAMPQYYVGHHGRVERIFAALPKYPGLFLTGNAYWGVGIPECIERGEQTADKILNFLKRGQAPFCKKRPGPLNLDHVLLIGFGAPEKPEEVHPFLLEVMRGAHVPEERLKEVLRRYEAVGGRSPYNDFARGLRQKMTEALSSRGISMPIFLGMRNWHPFMKDTVAEIKKKALRKGIGIVLAPHRSEASWDKYLRCVEEAKKESSAEEIIYEYLEPWHAHPDFINAQADRVREIFPGLSVEEKKKLHIIFCAHSIPLDMAQKSHYAEEFKLSSELTARELGISSWSIAYQSRSGSPHQPWLGPDIRSVFSGLRVQGFSGALVVPIGFLCNNMEVLYDLDIEAKKEAEKAGLKYWRAPAAGDHPRFVSMLADLIQEHHGSLKN